MSDQPHPVLPQAPPPVAPPPILPAAVPVQPLEYTLPGSNRRPSILTAIGVLSIILASFSGLYSLFSGLQGFGFYAMSMASARATPATATIAGPAATMPGMQPAGPTAMRPAERQALIESLTKDKALSPKRRRHLDAILAAAGASLGADVISERGTMPDSRSGEPGAEYFVTRRGRMEVFDDRAVFFPSDGSPTVRVSAPEESSDAQGDDGSTTAAPATSPGIGPGGLTQVEIKAVVQQADTQVKASSTGGKGLTPQQVNTLQSLLAVPGQQLVPPATAQGAVSSSFSDPSGQVTLVFSNGSMLMLGPQGNILSQTSPAAFAATSMSISPWAVAAFIATAVVSAGLAVLLLVAGILMLRHTPIARRLHLIYAWLKIPAAVAGGVSFAYVMYEMMNGFGAAAGTPARIGWGTAAWAGIPAALSCIYPVALLIALNTRSVREYYHSVAAGE